MPNFYPGKMEKKAFEPYDPGVYRVLVKKCSHFDANGYDIMNMECEILEPSEKSGRKMYLSMFYTDHKIDDLVKVITGKGIMETWTGAEISQDKIFDVVDGETVKLRVGVRTDKNGIKRNEITEIITEDAKKSSTAPLDV